MELKEKHKVLQKAYREIMEYLADCFENKKPILSKKIYEIHSKLTKKY